MKLALYSDLHLETYRARAWELPALAVDAVILAGDIARHTQGLVWAVRAFPRTPIIYIAGNHEYYGANLGLVDELRERAEALGVHFLEQDALELGGVRFLGCTLWSAFDLYGSELAASYMALAGARINDYVAIDTRVGRHLAPGDTLRLHRQAVRWLDNQLGQAFDGKTVVVTHFAPHRRCVAPEHRESALSPYFVSDLARLMARHEIALWCHGHTHTNNDFIAEHGCRVLSNQRGYPPEFAAGRMGFREALVIEL